jgi:hypothetical protein
MGNMEKPLTFAELDIGDRFFIYGKADHKFNTKVDSNTFEDSSGGRYNCALWVRVLKEAFPLQPGAKTMKIEINITEDEVKYLRNLKTEFLLGSNKTLAEKLREQVKPKVLSAGTILPSGVFIAELVHSRTIGWMAFSNNKVQWNQDRNSDGVGGYAWPPAPGDLCEP